MKWFEDSKSKIVNYFNRKSSNPDELEIGKQRLADEPKQSWMDIIKGRIVAMGIVSAGFFGIAYAAGEDKKTGKLRFDLFEDWGGVQLAKLTKEGKKIANTPVVKRLDDVTATNRTYKFGRMLALDIIATTVAIGIWNVVGGLSAKKRADQTQPMNSLEEPSVAPSLVQNEPLNTHSSATKKMSSHTQSVLAQRAETENSLTINA